MKQQQDSFKGLLEEATKSLLNVSIKDKYL